MIKLFFLGTDKRSKYLKEMYEIESIVNEEIQVANNIESADIVMTPIPFSKDRIHITGESLKICELLKKAKGKIVIGGAMKAFKNEFEKLDICYVDLMEMDSTAYLNAIPTAEGAILKAMEYTVSTIHNANVLVLGFGRCGQILANKLKGLNANVFCEARKSKDLACIRALGYNVVELDKLHDVLKEMDVIFSTVPAKILGADELKLLKKDAVIIDIATSPGSVDYDACVKLGVNAHLELGLPAKVAPKAAAEYLKYEIDKIINRGI